MQSGTGSPARPSSSNSLGPVTSQVQDDSVFSHLADELTFVADRKAETEQALMEDLLAALRKEEKLLDADAWKFAVERKAVWVRQVTKMTKDKWVPFKERPEWDDIEPVPQDDGPKPVVPISYSKQFREVMDYFRAILAKDERSDRALQLTAEVIGLNSANYTVWHFRRLVLETLDSDLEGELIFMEGIADINYKNYQFWQHRRWIAQKRGPVAAPDEMKHTELVLNDDSKNYHAWSHRQWVLLTLGGWEGELDYCSRLLSEDIYNNSAWNQRYFVVTKDPSLGGLKSMLEPEVSYTLLAIHQAPSNESSWRYLGGLFKDDKATFATRTDVIRVCLEQLADGQNCIHALNLLLDLVSIGYEPSETDCSTISRVLGTWSSLTELAGLLCTRLEDVDGIRSRYWAWRRTMLPISSGA